ncbi:hypothetical protein F2P81_015680 [Scophthalmus maximus]|uniref:Uncharacterized protein n=1 Tax=Scophthalmus maximus TaxID=52904 RepID=A0A6A4SF07_SCOMX|nr:hypothetical protein F2P81_015680 [Scophthalmus maximus]
MDASSRMGPRPRRHERELLTFCVTTRWVRSPTSYPPRRVIPVHSGSEIRELPRFLALTGVCGDSAPTLRCRSSENDEANLFRAGGETVPCRLADFKAIVTLPSPPESSSKLTTETCSGMGSFRDAFTSGKALYILRVHLAFSEAGYYAAYQYIVLRVHNRFSDFTFTVSIFRL